MIGVVGNESVVMTGVVVARVVVTRVVVTRVVVTGSLGVPVMVAVAMVVCFKEPADPRDGQSGDQGT